MRTASLFAFLAVTLTTVFAAATPVFEETALASRSLLKNGKTCSQSVQCKSGFCNRAKCDDKMADGKRCYKNVGCVSGLCDSNGKCATTTTEPSGGQAALGTKCSASAQCGSGYCGYARCATKAENGKGCYKDVGCTSGSCVKSVCSASQTGGGGGGGGSTDGGSGKGNLGDFSSGTLGAWTGSPADKVSVVADPASPGGYVVRMTSGGGGGGGGATTNTTITRSNIPASVQEQNRRQVVPNPTFYLAAQFEFRVTNYTRLATVNVDPVTTACSANIIVNGQPTGLQSIGGGSGPDPPLNTWYSMSNGNLGYTDQLTSVSIGPFCQRNAVMTMDIRNITKYVDDLRKPRQSSL